ncbi:MAG: acetyltransferase [Herpetosiphonaceae bacterium]|nr:MAG: acetyltransferase [Herpetosiphonaceae bacterium]
MLLRSLNNLYQKLQSNMRERWNRDLPFDELMFDRWERAKSLGFGNGTSVYHNSYIYGDVRIGKKTWVGPYTLLDGTGGLTIGDYCSISAGVHIYTHDTVKWAVSGGRAPYEYAPVKIGNCCYIGAQTVIIKGVTIGDHCVIGAGSFVNRDVPPYTVAAGIPCRPIGSVEIDENGNVILRIDKK